MKGVSSVIAAILILLITIAIAAFAFAFFTRIIQLPASTAEQQLAGEKQQISSSFRIDNVNENQVFVRNTGTTQAANFAFFVNNVLVNASGPAFLAPGQTAVFSLDNNQLHEISNPSELRVSTSGWTTQLAANVSAAPAYLMVGMEADNYDSDLYIEYSFDGINFTSIKSSPGPVYTGVGGNHVIDSDIMFYQGQYYLVYHQRTQYVIISKSSDLLNWQDIVSIQASNEPYWGVNDPSWFIDRDGSVHIIISDSCDHFNEIHALNNDASTWASPAGWSNFVVFKKMGGIDFVNDQDPYIVYANGMYNMVYSRCGADGPFWTTSTNLVNNWGSEIDLRSQIPRPNEYSEQPSMYLLPDGKMRMYWSDGLDMYRTDSLDTSFMTWGPNTVLKYTGTTQHLGWGKVHCCFKLP